MYEQVGKCIFSGLFDMLQSPNSKAKVYWAPVPGTETSKAAQTAAPVMLKPKKVATFNMATQTVGLFYPSERELQKKRMEDEEKWAMEKQLRDRKPLLTSVSPGKGLSRIHLCQYCT